MLLDVGWAYGPLPHSGCIIRPQIGIWSDRCIAIRKMHFIVFTHSLESISIEGYFYVCK